MSADKSINERLRECAGKEFSEKGFEKASLRNICSFMDYRRLAFEEQYQSAFAG
ncbi:MAG: hypothetical protein K5921_10055 [Lachnospiraceae bacterium]|nr:hypothetical protein [Lachnospiraceae bacterium]